MIEYLKARFRSVPVKQDALIERGDWAGGMKNVQFVSFLQESGFRRRELSRHDKTKRLKKTVAVVAVWAVIAGCVWVAVESVQALTLF